MSETVGIVGLGAMGSAMAVRLVKEGYAVVGFDVRAEALEELEANGGHRAVNPRDVAEQADVVLLSLPSTGAFHEVVRGQGGLTSSGREGLVVIDTCTLPLADKEEGRRVLTDAGMTLIDGTVSGNRQMILSGDLTAYLSGDEAAYERWSPVVAAFTRKHTYVGDFGNASRIKFIINHLVCVLNGANAEAMALGLKAGLKAQDIYDLVKDSAATSRLWELRAKMMVDEDYTSSRGSFNMAHKDGPVIGDFAERMNFPVPMFQTALQLHQMGVSMGMNDIDAAAICRVYEQIGGVTRD